MNHLMAGSLVFAMSRTMDTARAVQAGRKFGETWERLFDD